uniref:Uncharacterized protein n=1 Tax=Fagus sylvatica TaxID=28930 RepID=A0A2N9H0L3_FAGSY
MGSEKTHTGSPHKGEQEVEPKEGVSFGADLDLVMKYKKPRYGNKEKAKSCEAILSESMFNALWCPWINWEQCPTHNLSPSLTNHFLSVTLGFPAFSTWVFYGVLQESIRDQEELEGLKRWQGYKEVEI